VLQDVHLAKQMQQMRRVGMYLINGVHVVPGWDMARSIQHICGGTCAGSGLYKWHDTWCELGLSLSIVNWGTWFPYEHKGYLHSRVAAGEAINTAVTLNCDSGALLKVVVW